jgi:hypothetical protein
MTHIINKALDFFKQSDVKALAVLFLPIIFWQIPLLLPRNFWFWGDMAFYFYPMTALGMEQWRSGVAPLWTHLIQCGFPLLADGQGALVYPLNLIMYFIFPSPIAQNLGIVIQTLLTAGLMYSFSRTIGLGRLPGVIAGWIWVFAGPIATSIGSPALNGLTWWPLLFLCAERMSSKFGWRLVAASGLVMGMGWLGGFPQTALYGIFGASGYMLFRTVTIHGKKYRLMAMPIVNWTIANILGVGIGAIQILPTLEMSSFSIRAGGTDYAFATQGSMLPTGLASFLFPTWTRLLDYWIAGPNLFIGFICFAAVLLTIQRKMDPRAVFFWALALLGCFISFGKFNPLYHYIYNWPGLHFLRVPARFLYLTMFCVSILSAMGFQRLFTDAPESLPVKRKMMNRLIACVALSLAGSIGGSVLLYQCKGMFLKAAGAYVKRSMIGQAYKMQNAEYYQTRINRMFTDVASALSPLSMEFVISILLALAALAIIAIWMRRPQAARYAGTALCLLAGTNFLFLWHGPLKVHTVKDLEAPPLAKFCARQPGLFRLYTVNSQEDIQAGAWRFDRLDPDYNVLFNVASAGVYSALGSKRYFELLGPLGNVNLAFGMPPVSSQEVEKGMQILNLLNARYVLSAKSLDIPGLRQERFGPLFLYKNETALERAFVVASAKMMPHASAMLDSMHAASFDPSETVLLDKAPAENVTDGKRAHARISLYQDRLIKLDATGPGWLVVTNLYYPGWHAWVDGKEAKIYCGDYVFQTLPLSTGDHAVELRFSSSSFNHGLMLTMLSIVAVLLLCMVRSKPRGGPQADPPA